jgi:hypothetical protein
MVMKARMIDDQNSFTRIAAARALAGSAGAEIEAPVLGWAGANGEGAKPCVAIASVRVAVIAVLIFTPVVTRAVSRDQNMDERRCEVLTY